MHASLGMHRDMLVVMWCMRVRACLCFYGGYAVAGKEAGGAGAAQPAQAAREDSARQDAAQAKTERAVSIAFGQMEARSGALAAP